MNISPSNSLHILPSICNSLLNNFHKTEVFAEVKKWPLGREGCKETEEKDFPLQFRRDKTFVAYLPTLKCKTSWYKVYKNVSVHNETSCACSIDL